MTSFILASASPARLKLLKMVGIDPIVHPSDYDESQVELTNPEELVNTLALNKAKTVTGYYPSALVLGCDSVLEVEGEIYGKPLNAEIALNRWQKMRGKQGKLYTGHALIDTNTTQTIVKCGITYVDFASVSDSEIKAYINTEEPLKCAGGFALEGRGGVFIKEIKGCHSNVIGLSLPLLRMMLQNLGFDITHFW